MKKKLILLSVAAMCLFLSGCGVRTGEIPIATDVPGFDMVLPEVRAPEYTADQKTVTLYFRYGDEELLAPEIRQISVTPDTSLEEKILSELLGGPDSHTTELNTLFPPGVRVKNVSREKRTLFVTMTTELMERPMETGETDRYTLDRERYLAVQSLVGTVTENCGVDEVQILLAEDGKEKGAIRLPASYFREGAEGPSGPVTRDSTVFLTPEMTAEFLMESWRNEAWAKIYPLLDQPQDDRLTYQDLVARMNGLPGITDFRLSGAGISPNGTEAVFSADITIRQRDGTVTCLQGRILRLKRVSGIWKTDYDLLTGWVVDQS